MKTKTVTIKDQKYLVGKLPADVGAFITLRLLGAGIQAGELATPDKPSSKPERQPTGEEMVRAVAFGAFLRNLKFEEFQFVQRGCMRVVSWLGDPKSLGLPMPVMNDFGQWTYPELEEDLTLVMLLTMEVLVWNLEDFFAAGGLALLMGTATTNP